MRAIWILLLAVMLSGCGSEPEWVQPTAANIKPGVTIYTASGESFQPLGVITAVSDSYTDKPGARPEPGVRFRRVIDGQEVWIRREPFELGSAFRVRSDDPALKR